MESKKLDIYCLNTNVTKQYPVGTSLREIADDQNIKLNKPLVGAFVNNKVKELDYAVFKPKVVQFFDLESVEGQRMYNRSLCMLLAKALNDVEPELRVVVDHSISKGFYCELVTKEGKEFKATEDLVLKIRGRMQMLVDVNLPIDRKEILSSKAADIFESQGLGDRVEMFKHRPRFFSSIYSIDGFQDYYTSYLVP